MVEAPMEKEQLPAAPSSPSPQTLKRPRLPEEEIENPSAESSSDLLAEPLAKRLRREADAREEKEDKEVIMVKGDADEKEVIDLEDSHEDVPKELDEEDLQHPWYFVGWAEVDSIMRKYVTKWDPRMAKAARELGEIIIKTHGAGDSYLFVSLLRWLERNEKRSDDLSKRDPGLSIALDAIKSADMGHFRLKHDGHFATMGGRVFFYQVRDRDGADGDDQ
jgi:hypothetical protein